MLPRHFLSVRLTPLALCAALAGFSVHAAEPGAARFDIARFQVEGNTLVSSETIARAVAPLTGAQREFSDIQRAVDAIERAYVQSGFTAVKVTVPEQELAGGAVKIRVVEAVMTPVTVVGNQHFSTENIRASLGSLQTGAAPRLGDLSASIQLANDNPAKQVSVSMAEGSLPGTVDATVSVVDHKPLRFIATLDNTGTAASGHWRSGIAVQHANLFDRDHVGTLAYSTSPDGPSGQNLNVYSVGYRVPLYALGDSIDFVYGRSSVNTPASSPTLGGVLGFTGRGETLGLRYNHFLGRSGETAAKLVFGLDHKKIDSRCDVNGMPVSTTGATPPISSCVPYTTTPLSITYTGQRDGVEQALAYNIGLARNLASGTRYTNLDGRTDRYSYLTPGNRSTRDGFMVLRGGATVLQALDSGWQVRLGGNAQLTNTPLVASEQLSLVGANAVRGFDERAVAADSGLVLNAELYTPELGPGMGLPVNLRALVFVDAGYGANRKAAGTYLPSHTNVASTGVGARYTLSRDFSARLDVARVLASGSSFSEKRGDWRAHLSAMFAF
ncbi:ShlB/FhaC/HecB family hemolysin secretion/activation protein [Acidovorax sp. CCYZU-2555]|uniref:ShlB/FhaC/HecB family hemolysin secretion/activation protein n=1 Tax=Acidovorax sp. CCYZU-2555 TaxID=2835042 RepID=UPI001BCFE80C|nr:ShlB/FhaC/HecB family hemolysin secretion/activation protein [Acidovorax sp. CCYZU-2555]MBS7776998.1 ShlB/FhaC/HecB family hemolysin secretion/activation protein [Acidovorax sp. CCYZU-2555]